MHWDAKKRKVQSYRPAQRGPQLRKQRQPPERYQGQIESVAGRRFCFYKEINVTQKLQAPIEVDLKISITDGVGKIGTVTIGMGHGAYPTEQELRDRVAKFESQEMPDGFRMMTKREWFNNLFGQCQDQDGDGEVTYMDWAMPGGDDWAGNENVQAVQDKVKMLLDASERLGLPLDSSGGPVLHQAIAHDLAARLAPPDALLFELHGPDGQRWAIHLDGRFEGFPNGTLILNHAIPLVDGLLGIIHTPDACAPGQKV